MTAAPTLHDVHETFGRWLEFPTEGPPFELVDITMATVVANRMDGDPLWLFLVAPPSGGKTAGLYSATSPKCRPGGNRRFPLEIPTP